MYNTAVIDTTTARKDFSKIIERVFLTGESYLVTKRNIPLVKIIKVEGESYPAKERLIDLSLFGILTKNKKNAVKIAAELRKKTWMRE